MEDIVDLGDTSHGPSAEAGGGEYGDYGVGFSDAQPPMSVVAAARRGGGRSRGRSSAPSQSLNAPVHKMRGPNWTEQEMLVLIGQKHVEWDGRHNCSQPSLAKFVYGSAAWKSVLAGCMSTVGFRARDADQLTNKWDGLVKDYKKLKDYIEGTGFGNWWGMSREGKRELCKTRKMPLEFTESMYNEMEAFVGKRQIFSRATDTVDSDRLSSPPSKNFCRSPPSPHAAAFVGAGSPACSATTTPISHSSGTPGDAIPGSTGRKRKATGNDNLVDFVKDFNCEFLARSEAQEREKRSWRSEVMSLDKAREARIAQKEMEAFHMEQKLYNLEVERTRNMSNMTTALLMLASSMDALSRFSM